MDERGQVYFDHTENIPAEDIERLRRAERGEALRKLAKAKKMEDELPPTEPFDLESIRKEIDELRRQREEQKP